MTQKILLISEEHSAFTEAIVCVCVCVCVCGMYTNNPAAIRSIWLLI